MTVVVAQAGEPPERPKRILSAEQTAEMLRKEKIVMDHRIRGWSFHKIEREFGIHNPDRIFKRAIARDENAPMARAEALRLENLRLDELQDGIWDKALGGDSRAVEIAIKVLERRAKLHGLDFADMVSGRLVEVEQAKVALMATAFTAGLEAIGATHEQMIEAKRAFIAELRAVEAANREQTTMLAPEDEDLL